MEPPPTTRPRTAALVLATVVLALVPAGIAEASRESLLRPQLRPGAQAFVPLLADARPTGTPEHRLSTDGVCVLPLTANPRPLNAFRLFEGDRRRYVSFRARTLWPELGRFGQEDPAGTVDSPNRYQALGGEWNDKTDPAGRRIRLTGEQWSALRTLRETIPPEDRPFVQAAGDGLVDSVLLTSRKSTSGNFSRLQAVGASPEDVEINVSATEYQLRQFGELNTERFFPPNEDPQAKQGITLPNRPGPFGADELSATANHQIFVNPFDRSEAPVVLAHELVHMKRYLAGVWYTHKYLPDRVRTKKSWDKQLGRIVVSVEVERGQEDLTAPVTIELREAEEEARRNKGLQRDPFRPLPRSTR